MSLYQSPDLYDLYYNENNEAPLKGHYQNILAGKSIETIHDCAFGTGNLSFVLADMGYTLSGSDISQVMIKRAKDKAEKRGLVLDLSVQDFTKLYLKEPVDLIMCTGNSLPHVNDDMMVDALIKMKAAIKDKGYLYIDLRNWDNILDEKTRFQAYPPVIKDDKRTNMVLVRDFHDEQVIFNFVYTFEESNRLVDSQVKTVDYFPVRRARLIEVLKGLGFINIETYNFINHDIKDFSQMKWYGVICQKS